MNALEQSLVDLCKQHGLNSISFSVYPAHADDMVTCYAHKQGKCGSGTSATFAAAAGRALKDLIDEIAVEVADEAPVVL